MGSYGQLWVVMGSYGGTYLSLSFPINPHPISLQRSDTITNSSLEIFLAVGVTITQVVKFPAVEFQGLTLRGDVIALGDGRA